MRLLKATNDKWASMLRSHTQTSIDCLKIMTKDKTTITQNDMESLESQSIECIEAEMKNDKHRRQTNGQFWAKETTEWEWKRTIYFECDNYYTLSLTSFFLYHLVTAFSNGTEGIWEKFYSFRIRRLQNENIGQRKKETKKKCSEMKYKINPWVFYSCSKII